MQQTKLWTAALSAAVLLAGALPSQAQGQGRPGQGRGRGGGGSLLSVPEVQKELKLDAAQIELLQGLSGGRERGNRESFQNLTPEQRRERFEAARKEREKKIGEILNPTQQSRLKQLELQREGIRAVAREDVASSLKLSADQKSQIRAALDAERAAMQQAGFRRGGDGGQRPTDEQRRQAFEKLREARSGTDAKLNAILTAPQKQQFAGMQGAPFTFPERRRGERGPGARPRGNRTPGTSRA